MSENFLRFYSGLLKEFKKQHPEVNYTFQTIPSPWPPEDDFSSDPEKKALFDSLRTEIMSGAGPDLFLLPSSNTGLFPDLEKTMRAGVFLDVEPLLGEALQRLNLQPQVMAAGMVGEARYIVPLTYEVPVLLTTPELFAGCTAGLEDSPLAFLQKLQDYFDMEPLRKFGFFEFYLASLSASPFLDYDAQTVRTDEEVKKLAELGADAYLHRGDSYDAFPSEECPFRLGIAGADSALLAEAWAWKMVEKGHTPLVVPFPNGAGGSTATAGLFAAVRSNTKQPDLAAQIIEFLLSTQAQSTGGGARFSVNLDATRQAYENWWSSFGVLQEDLETVDPRLVDPFAACAETVNRAVIGRKANQFFERSLIVPLAYYGITPEDAVAELETAMRFYFEE